MRWLRGRVEAAELVAFSPLPPFPRKRERERKREQHGERERKNDREREGGREGEERATERERDIHTYRERERERERESERESGREQDEERGDELLVFRSLEEYRDRRPGGSAAPAAAGCVTLTASVLSDHSGPILYFFRALYIYI